MDKRRFRSRESNFEIVRKNGKIYIIEKTKK